MAKTSLKNLNEALFKMLDDLDGTDPMTGEDMTPEQIATTIKRADAVCNVSSQIIQVADLSYRAVKLAADNRNAAGLLSGMLPDVSQAKE